MRKNTGTSVVECKSRYLGCIVGAALGDNMGYAVEGMTWEERQEYFGEAGIVEPFFNTEYGCCLVSDDTQMALFTMDGLEWAHIRITNRLIGSYESSGVWQSYARWYYTQTGIILDDYIMHKHEHEPVALSSIGVKTSLEYEEFYSNRNPSEETLVALESKQMGTMEMPTNSFRDASCLTRVAPVGFFLHDHPEQAFEVAVRLAAITHGHPSGFLSAGVYAYIIAELTNGKNMDMAVVSALVELKKYSYIDEINEVVDYALHLSECDEPVSRALDMLGQGYSAEEVLAKGLYCALKAESFEEALWLAANCGGNSSATGFVAGSLVGTLMGDVKIPEEWQQHLELRGMMIRWVDKLYKLKGE